MQELPPSERGRAVEVRAGQALAREDARALARTRRRNRRWVVFLFLPGVLLGAAGLGAAVWAGTGSPSVTPLRTPPGYHAVSDGVFAYAVPAGWRQNDAYTDDVGDLDTSGPAGWVAEHLGVTRSAPGPRSAPPSAFRDFGVERPAPYEVSDVHPVTVAGASAAYRFEVTRPGGFAATGIHAWQAGTGADLWLLVRAPAPTTEAILSSLRG